MKPDDLSERLSDFAVEIANCKLNIAKFKLWEKIAAKAGKSQIVKC